MPFDSDFNNPDILENFDFEKFLQASSEDLDFDPWLLEAGNGADLSEQNSDQQWARQRQLDAQQAALLSIEHQQQQTQQQQQQQSPPQPK